MKTTAQLTDLFIPVLESHGIQVVSCPCGALTAGASFEGFGADFTNHIFTREYVEAVVELVKERATFVADMWDIAAYLFVSPEGFESFGIKAGAGLPSKPVDPNRPVDPRAKVYDDSKTAPFLAKDVDKFWNPDHYENCFEVCQYITGANFGFEDRMLYILDNEKILVLRYNNSGDICGKTGEELAASAVSRLVPEDVQDKVFNESHWYYGFLMDEHSFFTESHGGPQIIMVSFGRTESIKNPDGSLADMRDLYMGSQYTNVLLEIDEVLESYPLQAYPKNVVVY